MPSWDTPAALPVCRVVVARKRLERTATELALNRLVSIQVACHIGQRRLAEVLVVRIGIRQERARNQVAARTVQLPPCKWVRVRVADHSDARLRRHIGI